LQISKHHRKGIAIAVITRLILSVAVCTSAVPIPPLVAKTLLTFNKNIKIIVNAVSILIIINFFLVVNFINYHLLIKLIGHIYIGLLILKFLI